MLQEGEEKTIKVNKPNDILERITVIYNEILNSNYSHDIVVIDDTAMTNLYGLPLETMVVIDQEDHTQLLSYSILPNKSSTSFLNFFNDYIELGGSQFRIIVVDHLQAQIKALEKAFHNSYIVFCLVHIRRDLLLYFRSDDEIITGLDRAKAYPSYSYTYDKKNEPCVWCHLRMQNNNNLAIPCRHTIKTGYLINIDTINQRFLQH